MKTTPILGLATAAFFGLSAQAQTTADLGASAQIIAPPQPASIAVIRNATFGRVAQAPIEQCWYQFDPQTGALSTWSYGTSTGYDSSLGFNEDGCGRESLSPEAPIISLSCQSGTVFLLNAEQQNLGPASFSLGYGAEMSGSGDIALSDPETTSGLTQYSVNCGGSGTVESDFMFGATLTVEPNPKPEPGAIEATIPLEIIFE